MGFPAGISQLDPKKSSITGLFNGIMNVYHGRQLSFIEDKLKAIEACLKLIAVAVNIPIWRGMPMEGDIIAGALIWRHETRAQRTYTQFPSYSWASWDATPVLFRECDHFYYERPVFKELNVDEEIHSELPSFVSGFLPLRVAGEVARLQLKPSIENAWCLDNEKHPNSTPEVFKHCYAGDLSELEMERMRSEPSEFLHLVSGFSIDHEQVLVVAMLIGREDGYIVRKGILCMSSWTWSKAGFSIEELILC